MTFVSLLLPAFYFEDNDVENGLKKNLNINPDQYEICEILNNKNRREVGIKLTQSDFSLKSIEKILCDINNLKTKVDKCKDALTTVSTEYNQVIQNPTIQQDINQQYTNKKARKLKQLKEDNKKLRQLLKAQLENSEKLRLETQTTVETLREEFDLLVQELSNLQKKEQNGGNQNNSINKNNLQQGYSQSSRADYNQNSNIPSQSSQQQYFMHQQQQHQQQQNINNQNRQGMPQNQQQQFQLDIQQQFKQNFNLNMQNK